MTEIAPDLLSAATTLAGLLIVYLGGLVARVEGMDESRKSIVGPTYRRRGTLAFVGILAASLAAVLCILSHALNSDLAADIAAVLLAGAFFAAIGAVFIIYGHFAGPVLTPLLAGSSFVMLALQCPKTRKRMT